MTRTIEMINFKTHLVPDPTYYFGNRITHELGPLLKKHPHDKVFLVTNEILFNLYGRDILETLNRHDIRHDAVLIEDSETNKSFQTLEYLCETLVSKNISKGSIVIGFGGGCLTNIAGLAAGLIFRGIRYVEMPTTLMGMTDSSLSNKQAINGKYGKNQFGIYCAPLFLFGDTQYLKSEPVSGRRAALAEGIKNGFISDAGLLDYFESKLEENIADYSEEDLYELALKIIRSKLEILRKDPSEKVYAMTLEYGHTFGHAIEFFTKGQIPHGIAVAKGMCIAAELGYHLGYIPRSLVNRHYHLFAEKLGVDITIPANISVDNIMSATLADNKKSADGIKYVLLKKIGECQNPDGDYQVFVEPDTIRKILQVYKELHSRSSQVA